MQDRRTASSATALSTSCLVATPRDLSKRYPVPIRHASALYIGCIAGALPREHYLRLIEEAGFENVKVAETKPIELPDGGLHRHIDDSEIAAFRASGVSLQSITIHARKPARGRI